MCSAIAGLTDGFSFAYLQEALISRLLVLVNKQRGITKQADEGVQSLDTESLEFVPLWRVMNEQTEILRYEIRGSRKSADDAVKYNGPRPAARVGLA